ncbi:MAG: peptide-methionine (S)-S-oxide reductase MsrA [Pseudomonadota bacterium]
MIILNFRTTIYATIFMALTSTAQAGEETAIFAGGCFWCVESDFQDVKGVVDAVSGLTGGTKENPSYRSYGDHKEAVMITFDNSVISYRDLADAFLRSIDPTDDGGQFCDRGSAYKTAIFATTDLQREIAESLIKKYDGTLDEPIVTPVASASAFYKVDEYHQDYYKSEEVILLTRFGPTTKAKAYKRYRAACGRDAGVQEVWGERAYKLTGF